MTQPIWHCAELITSLCSGEVCLKKRENSGMMVLFRALWTTAFLFLITLWLRSLIQYCPQCSWAPAQLWADIRAHLGWMAAIFAVVYGLYYTRFTAQWKYMADLYNSISLAASNRTDALRKDPISQTAFSYWKSAFAADAQILHLHLKEVYSGVILGYFEEADVVRAYNTVNQDANAATELCKSITKRHGWDLPDEVAEALRLARFDAPQTAPSGTPPIQHPPPPQAPPVTPR